jgi:hypothetical protein
VSTEFIQATICRGQRPVFVPPTTETYTDGIDWNAIERAVTGDTPIPTLTDTELRAAVTYMTRAGWARKAISTHLGLYERLIREWQADAGLLPDKDLCTTDGCRKAKGGRGLCISHLQAAKTAEKQWQQAIAEALEVAA